jgi:diguanylate cyclase (GGDEF)-like protein
MRILLIEDDEVLANILLQSLTSQHYVVDLAEDGGIGWECAQSAPYDLLLIDVGLPKLDGITLCQRLRSQGCSTPILLITAKDASNDRIRGLDAGADDYLLKPLDLGELQARVRALLRRGDIHRTPVLEVGALRLDPSNCQVTYAGKPLILTPKEYSLLELFLRNPSRVFSRSDIIEHLWTFDDPPQEESVKAHIKGLRQKLKAVGAVDWIENVYGLGYRLHPHEPESQGTQKKPRGSKTHKPAQSNIPTPHTPHPTPALVSQSIEQQFNQTVDQMWQQYQGLMAQRLAVLQQAATAVQAGGLSFELRQSAGQAAHKLAGVLGMFNRDAGTQIAHEIEQLLLGNGNLLPEQEPQLLSLIQALNDLLNLTTSEVSPGSSDPISPILLTQTNNKVLVPSLSTEAQEVQDLPKHHSCLLPNTARLLLIDPDPELAGALQQLAQSARVSWEQVATLKEAKTWLDNQSPDLVVMSIDEVGQREESLNLLTNLAKRTPSIPVLVLAAADGLVDRVSVARAGGRGFLVKPVTANQVWDVASQLLQHNRSQTVNVLVVDDDPVFLAALHLMLEPWGIRMTGLDESLRFWDVLQLVSPDLLILDVEMPKIGGIELCQAVRTAPNWQGLPILFLTAHRDLETIQGIFAAGADDYLVKPVVAPELLTRITHRLERTRFLQTLSTKNPLTGLFNQPKSSQDLDYLIEQAAANCSSLCLALFNVTQLRQINIEYGHAVGNQVLQRWGWLFQSAFCGAEVVGYWGNGEFVVGMPGLTRTEANDFLGGLLTTLRQQVFTSPKGNRFQVSCNFAIAEYPTDGVTLQSLYQIANSHLEER